MSRRALLLAIADYDPLPALGYVANDIPRLTAALTRAGFDPKHIQAAGAGVGGAPTRELTTTRLRGAIGDFLDSAEEHDEMLVFFSGHGIELDGRRVLLPQDFTPKHPGNVDDMITDSWISVHARGCKARSVLVLIDACREGARYALAPNKSVPSVGVERDAPLKDEYFDEATDAPTIAFFYSCAPGEQSGRDNEGGDYSAFTRAFGEAIEREKGPAELEPISADGRRRLATCSNGRQTLTASGRPGRAGPWQQFVVKEDEAARFRERLARSNWSCRLCETELFRWVEKALPAFAAQLRAIAMRAEEQVAEARRVLPIQRWHDDDAWYRQAERVRHIFLSLEGIEIVPAEEMAVLLAVPFVYETALAVAQARLAAAGAVPDPEAVTGSGYLVNAWRNAWRNGDAAQIRRGLIARNKQDAADDHSCWSLVDFCHTSGELWDAEGGVQDRSGWALDAVNALVMPAPLPEITRDHRVCEILSAPRLLRLARLMFADFDEVTLDASSGNRMLDPQTSSGQFAGQLTINEVRLAHLLALGSRVALDPRRMPSLLAEHVGVDEDLSAEWLRSRLSRAEWHRRTAKEADSGQDARWFDLNLQCANDAVDAALLAVVDALETYRTRLLQRQDLHIESMRDLLPAGFTINHLNAAPSGWHPTRPPLRFELDRMRIIGLLMGQQLYGEKWPALRELYQNALDACRYRRAAELVAVREGRARSGRAYQGRILLRFGREGSRRFVECVDDGIGMADRHIRRLFAYAGQRFSDSHEFHIDRARWDEAGIKFFPNSRFGVGVLSYFMLAEELDVVSRRWVSAADLAPAPVRARVIGSGSLFRLESVIDPTRLSDNYGTSVRLYLREDAPDHEPLAKSILDWLALAEVAVTISPETGAPVELPAGQPTDCLRALSSEVLLPVAGSQSTTGSPRVYIAPKYYRSSLPDSQGDRWSPHEQGFALVDGIVTGMENQPWPECLVVNLTEDLGKSLTVDRRRVDPDKEAIENVANWTRANGGAAVAKWCNPDFSELHFTLRELHPDVTIAADAALRASGGGSVTQTLPFLDMQWPLSVAGLSDLDPDIATDLWLASREEAPLLFRDRVLFHGRGRSFFRGRSLIRYDPLQTMIRREWQSSVTPMSAQGLFSRTLELIMAGLSLPGWLRHGVSFDTRNVQKTFPVTCRPVLAEVEVHGSVGLREVLRWTEADFLPVTEAMQKMRISWPNLLAFDLGQMDNLGPLHRKLCRLAFGNQLGWVQLVYFAQAEALPLREILKFAQDLANYGILLPDLHEPPPDMTLTELEFNELDRFFMKTRDLPQYYAFTLNQLANSDSPRFNVIEDLRVKFENEDKDDNLPPPGISDEQRLLLSRDFDGLHPYLRRITASHLIVASRRSEFGNLARAIEVARSLMHTGVEFCDAVSPNDERVAKFDALSPLKKAPPFIDRLFDAVGRHNSCSVWDLALAATAADTKPSAMGPILDLVEAYGGEVSRCREFVEFCENGGAAAVTG